MKKCMCWCLTIIELKNAQWSIEIHFGLFVLKVRNGCPSFLHKFGFFFKFLIIILVFKTFYLRQSNDDIIPICLHSCGHGQAFLYCLVCGVSLLAGQLISLQKYFHLTLRGPCITYSYKPTRCTISRIHLTKYCTCFGQVHCPSSAVSQHYIHSNTC
jgi:hypothetical protein